MAGMLIPALEFNGISTTIEPSVSLLAINADFTLFKQEARSEYRGADDVISADRREHAEQGQMHKTAMRLGALFDGVLPEVPQLLRTYGTRVSEICRLTNINTNEKKKSSIFSAYHGPDITSIWAAATSGDNAIAVHLLACIIAQMFDQTHAVSLWAELVAKRKARLKAEVETLTDGYKKQAALNASMQDITRNDLSTWDNSARAWLNTAIGAKSKENRRVMLRVDRMGAAVNRIPDPYESVVEAWVDAMLAMENMIKGIPQGVPNGAVLVGVVAWQLYPDMNVPSEGPAIIPQNDPLIPKTGILTIGLEARENQHSGVHWSLPLSYMRYYGPPVSVEQSLTVESNRIGMSQFAYILIGCIISQWHDFRRDHNGAMAWLSRIAAALKAPASRSTQDQSDMERMSKITSRNTWTGILTSAAEEYQEGDDDERNTAIRLINNLGRRHPGFLCLPDEHPAPLFGLSEMAMLFPLLSTSSSRLSYLRQLSLDWGFDNRHCVIQYRHTGRDQKQMDEYASVTACAASRALLTAMNISGRPIPTVLEGRQVRWLPVYTKAATCACKGPCLKDTEAEPARASSVAGFSLRASSRACPCWKAGGCSVACHSWKKCKVDDCGSLHDGQLTSRAQELRQQGEVCFLVHKIADPASKFNGQAFFSMEGNFQEALIQFARDVKKLASGDKEVTPTYVAPQYCAGHRETAVILQKGYDYTERDSRTGRPGASLRQLGNFLPAKTMEKVFDPQAFNYYRLTEWFATSLRRNAREYVRSLRACAAATELYTRLGTHATIKTSVSKQCTILGAKWLPKTEPVNASPFRMKLSKSEAFACLAMFESGYLNCDPIGLDEVYALSSGNSIYASSRLICDPSLDTPDFEILRVTGNIGEPGLSFLVPPPDKMHRELGEDSWTHVDHKPFVGSREDHFGNTTIHLLKTEFKTEVRNVGDHGYNIDREAVLREIVPRVYDGETWVGDINILAALKSPKFSRLLCQADEREKDTHLALSYNDVFSGDDAIQLVSADHWDEVFSEHIDGNAVVVRATAQTTDEVQHNWLARIAAGTIAVQLQKETIVLPERPCWSCLKKRLGQCNSAQTIIIN